MENEEDFLQEFEEQFSEKSFIVDISSEEEEEKSSGEEENTDDEDWRKRSAMAPEIDEETPTKTPRTDRDEFFNLKADFLAEDLDETFLNFDFTLPLPSLTRPSYILPTQEELDMYTKALQNGRSAASKLEAFYKKLRMSKGPEAHKIRAEIRVERARLRVLHLDIQILQIKVFYKLH